MSRMIARSSLLSVAFAAALLVPARASAQVYFVAYLGTNYTQSADVTLDIPAADLAITFQDVSFNAHPFRSPQEANVAFRYQALRPGAGVAYHN